MSGASQPEDVALYNVTLRVIRDPKKHISISIVQGYPYSNWASL